MFEVVVNAEILKGFGVEIDENSINDQGDVTLEIEVSSVKNLLGEVMGLTDKEMVDVLANLLSTAKLL